MRGAPSLKNRSKPQSITTEENDLEQPFLSDASPAESRVTDAQVAWLMWLNKAGFWLHLLSGIVSFIVIMVYRDRSFLAEIVTNFRQYNVNATGPAQAGPFSTQVVSRGFLQLIWVDLPFPFITALFHGLIAWAPLVRGFYLNRLKSGRGNPLRWLEYAITASLMTWVIAQLSGVTDPTLLALLVVCNVALQLMGFIQEQVPRSQWAPTLAGWIIFAGQWFAVILPYFAMAVTSPRPPGAEQVPWFVWSIILGLLGMFSVFGLVQLAYVIGWPLWLIGPFAQEVAYIVLSFTAKLFLTWNLNVGMALSPMTTV